MHMQNHTAYHIQFGGWFSGPSSAKTLVSVTVQQSGHGATRHIHILGQVLLPSNKISWVHCILSVDYLLIFGQCWADVIRVTVPKWPGQSRNWPLASRVLDGAAFVPGELCGIAHLHHWCNTTNIVLHGLSILRKSKYVQSCWPVMCLTSSQPWSRIFTALVSVLVSTPRTPASVSVST